MEIELKTWNTHPRKYFHLCVSNGSAYLEEDYLSQQEALDIVTPVFEDIMSDGLSRSEIIDKLISL